MDEVKLVIVTPAHNEAENIGNLAVNLESLSTSVSMQWIVVDDNSVDGTSSVLRESEFGRTAELISVKTSGRLIEGGAFLAWHKGVEYALEHFSDFTHIMKLDADVVLDAHYFVSLEAWFRDPSVGVLGGVITRGGREQNLHVPGPVKIYSRACLEGLRTLPLMPGFDVMDEVVATNLGLKVIVETRAKFELNRRIGGSQGALHGRRRNGMICRWVGYNSLYFTLHVIRYIFRKPYVLGSVWMIAGYLTASEGPYSKDLRGLHAQMQKKKIAQLASNPVKFIGLTYSTKDRS